MTTLEIDVYDVGGIDEASFAFESPVSIITGPNATNKTSLLRALAFALGVDDVPIRSEADEAEVTLTVGDRSVTRRARRSGRGIRIEGESWIPDPEDRTLFEYFGCLLEFNPLRSAVRQNDDIEPVLKEPVDIERLEAEQSAKMDEKRRLQREVEELQDVEDDIRTQERKIEKKEAEKEDLEEKLERLQRRQAETSDTNDRLDQLREERADVVVELEDVEQQTAAIEDAIDRLEAKREDLAERLDEKRDVADQYDVSDLKAKRQSLREEVEDIVQRQEILQSVVSTNREILHSEHAGVLGQDTDLLEESVTCWVCGQPTPVEDIEDNIEQLQSIIEQDKQKRREYEPRIEDIDDRIEEAKSARRAVTKLEQERNDVEQKLDERRESLATKRERAESLRAELSELDDKIADAEADQTDEITDLTEQIESVRVDLQTTRQAIEQAESRIERLEEKKRERAEKAERIDDLSAEIAELTDRIENLEHHLREEFNAAMDDILGALDFQRIERVRLDGQFDLVVARDVDGTVRQDSVGSLSESEREVVGLVLALAGYATYDLDGVSPVLQMDTLGALDSTRVAQLVEYFSGTPDFLIAAVLPENATEIDSPTVKPVEQTQLSEASD